MADRPIIFSGPMVRALLDGRKTQHRMPAWRLVKHDSGVYAGLATERKPTVWQKVRPGDRLWVREGWAQVHPASVPAERDNRNGQAGIPGPPEVIYRVVYRADGDVMRVWNCDKYPYRTPNGPRDEIDARHPDICSEMPGDKHQPWGNPIHMPRWASRLTLIVMATKIERLQDISERDSISEGISLCPDRRPNYRCELPTPNYVGAAAVDADSGRSCFRVLWNSLHGPGSWEANPEVVALTFDVVKANIDAPASFNGRTADGGSIPPAGAI